MDLKLGIDIALPLSYHHKKSEIVVRKIYETDELIECHPKIISNWRWLKLKHIKYTAHLKDGRVELKPVPE